MEVYRAEEDDLIRVEETQFDREETLENHLVKSDGATIGAVEVLYIGRQGSPDQGGIFDILSVDEAGDVVILELKRDKSPRGIVSQALEYASGIRRESYDHLDERYQEFVREHDSMVGEGPTSLRETHRAYFDLDEPLSEREFNANQRLILVANDFRDVSLNMADFLREHDIDVICVEYEAYATEDSSLELVTTDAVRRPLEEEPTGTSSDEGPEYRNLLFSVRDRIYLELEEMLHIDSPEEINRSGTKQLGFPSRHPDHPDAVRYGVKPELDENRTVTIRLNVWGGGEEEKSQVRSIVSDHVEALDNYELTDDYESSMVLLEYEMEPDPPAVTEELIDDISKHLVELVEYFHPKFVKQVQT